MREDYSHRSGAFLEGGFRPRQIGETPYREINFNVQYPQPFPDYPYGKKNLYEEGYPIFDTINTRHQPSHLDSKNPLFLTQKYPSQPAANLMF
jgi:hypothetical protein